MSFSAGVYTLPGAALNTGDTVSATENNTLRNDMASSFNLTWLRNGTAAATANIPMGGFKFTGLGNGIANGDSIAYGQSADVVLNGLTVGKGAGAVSTNTAVGASALGGGSQSGNHLAAFGKDALGANSSGVRSVAAGSGALSANTTGSYNVGVGTYDAGGAATLASNTTGSNLVAVGIGALASNTTASNNTAVGYQAGYTNTTGIQKTCVGSLAGYSGTASTSSTCVGYYAGYSTTGTDNTLIGTGAGYLITSGAKNTVLGEYSGNQGGLDIRTASNYVVLSDGDGNPRGIFDGSGNLLVGTTSSGSGNTTGFSLNNPAGSSFISIGHITGTASGFGYGIFCYNGSTIGSITQAGTTGVLYNVTSDYRLKNVIGAVSGAGERIDALEPIEYQWKSDGSNTRGFLAHKFQEVYPQSVSGEKDAVDENGNPKYQTMQASTSEVIADLVAEIQSLRKRLAAAGI